MIQEILWATMTVLVAQALGAQGKPAHDHSLTVELNAGVVPKVPRIGDTGLGPLAGLTFRIGPEASGIHLVVSGAYALVFANGYTDPTGQHVSYTPEGIVGGVGIEGMISRAPHLSSAIDFQWNPAHTRVTHRNMQANSVYRDSPWFNSASTVSAGLRLETQAKCGPRLGLSGRLFMDLSALALGGGNSSFWPALTVSVRPQ